MRRTFSCNIVLLVAIFFLVNNNVYSQDAIITGRIKYGNEPLQGATIFIGNKSIITDQDGKFTLPVKAGAYTIIITHVGYKKIEQTIIAQAGSTENVEFDMMPGELLDGVTIHSRSKIQRSNLITPVPVDVYSFDKIIETGQISLTQMLNFLAPSFTASREILHEPLTLRGLDPQHVLILINGNRYHSMVWLFSGGLKGQLGKGSVGNDLNSIPFPAIERIEVLRDGAAAQYGSDAIAGVINIKLKTTKGTSFHSQLGQFYKGDGEKIVAGLYQGFVLKNKHLPADRQGFLGFSAYYRNQAATFRGATYEGLIYLNYPIGATRADSTSTEQQDELLVRSRGFNRKAVIENAGNTKLISKGISMNMGIPLNDRIELFLTTFVNDRKLDRSTAFRLPRDSTRINYYLYPDGVQPRSKPATIDVSIIAGIKGKTKKDLYWDISNSYGSNSIENNSTKDYNVTQTFILREKAQTSFYSGTDVFKQLTNDINFLKQFSPAIKQIKRLNLGWGAEWRLENYQTKLGEEAFWQNFDTTNYPRVNVLGPENVVNKSRNVFGAYAELESEYKNSLLINIATRYEYYNDLGGNLAGKLAARYKISPKFIVRTSINNGFRAPSLQQRYMTSIGYALNVRRETIISGTFPNDHAVVRALNIPVLTAEKTINISGGVTSTLLKNINLTVDAYWIQIKNRIVLSGSFEKTPGNTIAAILAPYPALSSITRIAFFANSINTKTKGIDIVIDGKFDNKKESLELSLAANFNSTLLFGPIKTSDKLAVNSQSSNTLFNSEDRTRIEKGQPGSKIILSMIYKTGKTKLIIRNTRFGSTAIAPLGLPQEIFSSKILTDISITYSPKTWASFTIGANNIANIYPDRLKHKENTSSGGWVYSPEASPFGFNGGYYFVNMIFNW
jgi:iron complex outermembrane recepter protein